MENRFYQSFDVERRGKPSPNQADDHRTPFQQDRDRIIHTGAFRRLQNKTQVFFSGEYDFYRTRLTHSIEVAQIGRGICQRLIAVSDQLDRDYFIDPDLVEACCLSHDLGHPPFGHTGESVIHRMMKPFGGFEGNAQTLRLLGNTAFGEVKGINPTRAMVDGVLKYKTLYSELDNPPNHFIYDDQKGWLDFVLADRPFPKEATPGKKRDAHKSIECQIMDWADDTAYSLNDIADGIQAGFLTIEKIEKWAGKQTLTDNESQLVDDLLENTIRRNRIESTIGYKIGQFIRHTEIQEQDHFLADLSNRYRYKLVVPQEIKEESKLYKKMAFEIVFRSQQMSQLDRKADVILTRLFEEFARFYIRETPGRREDHYKILSDDEEERIFADGLEQKDRARLVCDSVARMTDGVVRRNYKRLFEVDYGSIGDLVSG
ncbi:MAG: dNTP triphosphohydrolase [Verrucomicrobiales bacterium]|nr:dNTP triphosphohydrolase [Verrucomicrobiales bacterium]